MWIRYFWVLVIFVCSLGWVIMRVIKWGVVGGGVVILRWVFLFLGEVLGFYLVFVFLVEFFGVVRVCVFLFYSYVILVVVVGFSVVLVIFVRYFFGVSV